MQETTEPQALQHYELVVTRQALKYGTYEETKATVKETVGHYESDVAFATPLLALLNRMYLDLEHNEIQCPGKEGLPS
ncbi:MAG: hypothetical protein EOM42_07470 [Negativicutes bacterium]|nr:hypothetical protein [Negativicutes bacterium]